MFFLRHSLRIDKKGFTMLELMIVSFLIIMVTGTIAYSYITILKATDEQYARSQIRAGMNIALESVVVDLRHAFQLSFNSNNKSIRYQVDESGAKVSYIYYWQDQAGPCPTNAFSAQSIYDIKRTPLNGGLNGTYACGDGDSIIRNLVPPPTSSVTVSGSLVTFDLTARVKDSQVRVGTAVTARNLL